MPDLVQIAERTYWIGSKKPGSKVHCNIYLIENGKNSILVDPGPGATFRSTLDKIREIVPFGHIRYFICSHQDPDISSSIPLIDGIVSRKDAAIISHWRAIVLLEQYNISVPFMDIEKNNWELDAEGRKLRFVFTPYMHFPGAFCTYDELTGILFSSDIFGGFSGTEWELFAKDESYFETIKPFHEHYIPSKRILNHGLMKIEPLKLEMIAPQHGSIIKKELIAPIIKKLKDIDCGLFLLTQTTTRIRELEKINDIMENVLHETASYKYFENLVHLTATELKKIIPLKNMEFLVCDRDSVFSFKNSAPLNWRKISRRNHVYETVRNCRNIWKETPGRIIYSKNSLSVPLLKNEGKSVLGSLNINLKAKAAPELTPEIENLIVRLAGLLSVSVQRELISKKVEMEKEDYYEKSSRDIKKLRDKIKNISMFQRFFYKNSSPMIIFDPNTFIIIEVNDSALKYSGFSKEEITGKTINEIDPFISPDKIPGYLHKFKNENVNTFQNIKIVLKNGTVRDIEAGFTMLYLNGRQVILVDISDVTERLRLKKELLEQKERYKLLSITDMLTMCYNRRKFEEDLEYHIKLSERYGGKFSLIMFDIDRFKSINDTYGHSAGDNGLRMTAATAMKHLRETDIIYRVGGEEFVIISPSTEIASAAIIAERIRKTIETTVFEDFPGLTCSFGITELIKEDSPETIFKRVDDMMYRAKQNGRNRIETG